MQPMRHTLMNDLLTTVLTTLRSATLSLAARKTVVGLKGQGSIVLCSRLWLCKRRVRITKN